MLPFAQTGWPAAFHINITFDEKKSGKKAASFCSFNSLAGNPGRLARKRFDYNITDEGIQDSAGKNRKISGFPFCAAMARFDDPKIRELPLKIQVFFAKTLTVKGTGLSVTAFRSFLGKVPYTIGGGIEFYDTLVLRCACRCFA